jgi:hypothetical protein
MQKAKRHSVTANSAIVEKYELSALFEKMPNKTLQPTSRAQRVIQESNSCSRGLRLNVDLLAGYER